MSVCSRDDLKISLERLIGDLADSDDEDGLAQHRTLPVAAALSLSFALAADAAALLDGCM